jgi:hypothetical protein
VAEVKPSDPQVDVDEDGLEHEVRPLDAGLIGLVFSGLALAVSIFHIYANFHRHHVDLLADRHPLCRLRHAGERCAIRWCAPAAKRAARKAVLAHWTLPSA